MKNNAFIQFTAMLLAMGYLPAGAYENENAVPLTLGLEQGQAIVEKIEITLDGRLVDIAATLKNEQAAAQKFGWYVSTPQFGILGNGEEHLDKSFFDAAATLNDRPLKPLAYHRGYFMGRDITNELVKAGLSPLPSLKNDEKKITRIRPLHGLRLAEWKGYASYSWNAAIPARSTYVIRTRYRALPEFGLTDLDSTDFIQAINQHCGDASAVRQRIRHAYPNAHQVIVERYILPINFMLKRDVSINIIQPALNWQEAHPVSSLLCGLRSNEQSASISGTVINANLSISILIVSTLPNVATANDNDKGHGK